MADGVRRLLGADVGVSTTGVAGPAEQEGQPAGTVWLGVAVDDDVVARQLRLPGDRDRVRQLSVISLMDLLRRKLLAES
jgi:nicotinamide mononucleotide (NMN) deamidase PncC